MKDSADPWYDYIQKHCYDSSGLIIREPAGAFLNNDTEKIHGVLMLSTNRKPLDVSFRANPFVVINNDPNIII